VGIELVAIIEFGVNIELEAEFGTVEQGAIEFCRAVDREFEVGSIGKGEVCKFEFCKGEL